MDISSSNIIVTGVSSGLGRAIAENLVRQGATVYGIARTVAKLNDIEEELGSNFISVPLDITNEKGVELCVEETFDEDSLPDVLINNAGAGYFGKIDELPPEKWHRMIDTNLNGTFYLTRNIVSLMKEKNSPSHIINIGSVLGTMSNPKMSAYSVTKFGIRGFSEALFKELRYDDIKVSCINPGSIETDFFEESGIKKHSNMLQPEAVAGTVAYLLQTPDNMLISDMVIRPLNPKRNKP